ncbi:sensor domain-containing protein [Halogeometricum sp. CBA1124]|uniref:sensor domain-containing protein n=1 Tax=Halogeometricum sp. CBA1124 TaxID=2668071 RepID=UPI001429184C|nr:sensor domain-containing protein [Halogeometricum sp. CBA1124]MUV57150.1 histidine kinase [Halogeometricum sp. CBA1124]
MPSTDDRQLTVRRIIAAVIGPVLSGRTYRNLFYLVLAFPLTMLYWSLFSFGLFLGSLLSIVLVGVAILALMIFVVRALATLERWLANSLLTVSLEAPDDVTQSGRTGGDFRGYIDAASTWRGFGFLSLKSFLGLIGVVLVYGLVQGVTLLSAGVRRPLEVSFGEVNGDPVIWTIETVPETVLAMGIGAILVLLVVHLANGFGYVAERMALALLGASAEGPAID